MVMVTDIAEKIANSILQKDWKDLTDSERNTCVNTAAGIVLMFVESFEKDLSPKTDILI